MHPTPADPSTPVLDIFHPDFASDPAPMIDRMLREQPIAFDPRLGGWLIGRHRDLMALHADPRLTSLRIDYVTAGLGPELRAAIEPLVAWYGRWIVMKDPPEHTRLRRLAAHAFQPRNLERLRGRIEQVTDQLIDEVMDAGEMEAVGHLAYPLPRAVISDMVGVPWEDRDRLLRWIDDFVALLAASLRTEDAIARAMRSYDDMRAYMLELIDQRRREPIEGEILSDLVAASDHDDRLTIDEVVDLVAFILTGGYETTAHLIASGLHLLLTHPEQLARVRREPALLAGAIEEALRLEPSITFNTRAVVAPIEHDGHRFEPGQLLYLVAIAANRDPERFPDPHRFDIGREKIGHTSFGFGAHYCLGAALARLEARVVFERLLARLPGLWLPEQPIARRPGVAVRPIERLVIRW